MSAAQKQVEKKREWQACASPKDVALVEEFIETLPPISEKRLDKHRGYILKSRHLWLKKSLEECIQQDLKRFVVELDKPETEIVNSVRLTDPHPLTKSLSSLEDIE